MARYKFRNSTIRPVEPSSVFVSWHSLFRAPSCHAKADSAIRLPNGLTTLVVTVSGWGWIRIRYADKSGWPAQWSFFSLRSAPVRAAILSDHPVQVTAVNLFGWCDRSITIEPTALAAPIAPRPHISVPVAPPLRGLVPCSALTNLRDRISHGVDVVPSPHIDVSLLMSKMPMARMEDAVDGIPTPIQVPSQIAGRVIMLTGDLEKVSDRARHHAQLAAAIADSS